MSTSTTDPSAELRPSLNVSGGAIDVHTHFLPDCYHDALARAGTDQPDNIPGLPRWSASTTLEAMDRIGIAASILSVSSPGVILPSRSATIALAREVNDECASVVRDAPGRFGFLASLPQSQIEPSLAELDRALGELGADGVVLMSNAEGHYISGPAFAPVLEELSRREAVVLLHPASPPNYQAVAFGRPTPILEFPFETTRTVADLILSGATLRFPGIRWIVPHAGAALPVLASRIAWVIEVLGTDVAAIDVNDALASFHYDLAGAPLPILLPALLALVGPGRVLYGSDMPFTPGHDAARLAVQLDESALLAGEAHAAVLRDNALTLFPRFSSTGAPQPERVR